MRTAIRNNSVAHEGNNMENFNYHILKKAVKNLILTSFDESKNIKEIYKLYPDYIYSAATAVTADDFGEILYADINGFDMQKDNVKIEAMSRIISAIIEKLTEEKNESLEDILNDFFDSYVCEDICDEKTGYYKISPVYLYALYNGDINTNDLL